MATVKMANDIVQLRALNDGKKVVVSKAIIRRDLYLDDADGVECLPNEEIFKELTRMGYEKPPPKLKFYKAFFFAQWKFLIHTRVQCLSANMVRNVDSPRKFLMYPCFLPVVMDNQVDDITTHNTRYTSHALTQKVFVNLKRVGEGFSGVETPLFSSMLVQPQPQPQAKEEVKIPIAPSPPAVQDPTPKPHATPPQDEPFTPHDSPPEEQQTTPHESSIPLLTTLMETPEEKSKEARQEKEVKVFRVQKAKKCWIEAIDADEGITLVDVETKEEVVAMDVESQGRINQEEVNATSKGVSAAESTIAQRLHDEEVQKAAARDKQEKADMERALELQRQKYQNLKKKPVSIAQAKKNMIIYLKNLAGYKMEYFRGMTYDKFRPIFEREYKKVKYPIIDWEIHIEGLRIYWKIIRVGGITKAYQVFEDMLKGFDREDLVALWNLVQEKFSLAVPIEDNEKALSIELKSKEVSDVSASKLASAAEPTIFDNEDVTMTMAQTLIKLKAEKSKLLDEQMAQKLHDEEPDKDVQEPKKKRVADETLLQESFKKLRAVEVSRSESTQEIPSSDPKEMNEEDVQIMLEIIPVSEFKVEALQVKYSIIDWEIHNEVFDREDLVALWNLVKEKFSSTVPCKDKEKALWVELKRLFEPDADDVLWKLKRYMHAPLTWKLYTDCGVHHVSLTRGHDIFMLIEKDYPLSNAIMILMLSGKLQVEEDNEMARDLVMKIFMEANKPKNRIKDNVIQRLKENSLRSYYCWFNITAAGLPLVLLDKVDAAAEVLKNLL
nr:hypothetical protein [Tanacetum cinerariifolium]